MFPDRHGRVNRSQGQDCVLIRQLIDRRYPEQVSLHGALEVEVVVELVGSGLIRYAAVKSKRAQARLDLVGDGHARRHRGGVLVLGIRRRTAEHLRHGRQGRKGKSDQHDGDY